MGMDTNSRPRITSPTIIIVRRSIRSASAPASGPNSSAGSSVASHTPPTAEPFATAPPVASEGASAVSATMLSQSPRLDRDSAIHSRRNGLIDRTPCPALTPGMVAPRGAVSGFPRSASPSCGAARKFTALAYRQCWPHNGLVPDPHGTDEGQDLLDPERAGVAAFFLVVVVLRRVVGGAARRSARSSAAR